jgi:hypothetical protein
MERTPLDSTLLKSQAYDPATGTLEIEFLKGGTYQYFNVPAKAHAEFLAAESQGKHFLTKIKGAYGFKKVEVPEVPL